MQGKMKKAVRKAMIAFFPLIMHVKAWNFVNGRKVNDYFYTGQKALFSLGYFAFPTKITAVLHPLHEGDHIYLQEWPKMDDKKACQIEAVTLTEQFT